MLLMMFKMLLKSSQLTVMCRCSSDTWMSLVLALSFCLGLGFKFLFLALFSNTKFLITSLISSYLSAMRNEYLESWYHFKIGPALFFNTYLWLFINCSMLSVFTFCSTFSL